MAKRLRYILLGAVAAATLTLAAPAAHAGPDYCTLHGPVTAVQDAVTATTQGGNPADVVASGGAALQQSLDACTSTLGHPGH